MTHSRFLLSLLLASCTLSIAACATNTDGPAEDAESQDNDLKKKVKPKGGNGAFDLVAPTTFNTAGFIGSFRFDNVPLKPGERSEKVPGTYILSAMADSATDGQAMSNQLSFAITAGAVAKHQLGGLRVRFSTPVTLGNTQVDLRSETNGAGYLYAGRPWQTSATGASFLVLAGKIGVTPATDGARIDVTVAENKLEEVVLPTAKVDLLVDAYDPDYPTPAGCAPTTVTGGASGYTTSANVRKADGSPNASFVVPAGSRSPVVVNAYGLVVSQATAPAGNNTFQLNRLEIDDVEVAQAGGGTQFVKGTVTMSRKNADGTFTGFNCTFPTHSGIDIPDGTYRVISRAQSASGVVTSTEDVTFP